ncbi:hypothetical protein DM860_001359 [Cuscuta australis]|uniref:Pentacotripeptide-repeat region of PRORP domain-containing protein n=1 Tax=Cuscuta australis TaxID=267555 RepID=A0A328DXB2_9ASTE|nr:hypothetical protein DM860_001359 [Cuscuta australis]
MQVFEWMGKKGIYEFSSRDHAVQINLICKVRGCSAAERYFRNLPEQARNDKTYGELLHCYVHEHRTGEALLHFQKMKELGFALSPRPFNEMMHVYAKSLQIEKVLGVFAELKKSKVSPDNESYRICISSFGLIYDLDGMERMLREMETQPHIVMDWCTYAVVAEFYEREFLVDKATDALEKAKMMLQKKKNSSHYLMNSDYENVIKSLVKLGELDEAMKFVKEWEVLGNWRSVNDISIPYTIVEEYLKKGSLQKAFNKIIEWTYKGRTGVDKLSRLLCNDYLKVDDLFQACCCFQRKSGWCTRSLKTAEGKTFLDLIPMNVKYTLRVPLLAHPENSTPQVNMDYENIIKSPVESGELNEARKMAIGWEASGNLTSLDDLNISKLIMDGYCERSLFMEAEAMAEAWTREEKCWVGGIWLILACHYQEHGKMVRGFECMRRFRDLTPSLKDKACVEIQMFLCMIEYSRRVTAAGFFRHGEEMFFNLYDVLCPP